MGLVALKMLLKFACDHLKQGTEVNAYNTNTGEAAGEA